MYSLTLEDWIAIFTFIARTVMAICFLLGLVVGSFR